MLSSYRSGMAKKIHPFFVCILTIYSIAWCQEDSPHKQNRCAVDTTCPKNSVHKTTPKRLHRKKGASKRAAQQFACTLLQDALELHKQLLSWDTFKIATAIFPLYVGTRMIDERLQNCFYDKKNHKNIYCIPKQCHDLAQWSIAIPITILSSQVLFGSTEELRETTRVFLLGLPFVFWTKNLLKKIEFDANMRPWNEYFDCTKRASGGFPSGHMAEATYTALLYGLRFGPRFAVPLGAVATFIGVSFVACNRHYISQIVAGAGLGAVYGLAAYKLVDSKLSENIKLGFKISNGGPAISASYTY